MSRKYTYRFSPQQWQAIYKRLDEIKGMDIPEQHKRICVEILENGLTTVELAERAKNDISYSWLISKTRYTVLSKRQIQNIFFDYFPECHIKKTNKGDKPKKQALRTEQLHVKARINTGVCHKCGNTDNLELHHMIPIALGGTNDDGNVIILCHECHKAASLYFREYGKQNPDIIGKFRKDLII